MSPRPNPGRTGNVDRHVKDVLRAALAEQERGGAWLARKMTEAGCPTSVQTVWKMLHTDRTVYVNEAVVIAATLGISVSDLVGSNS